VINFTVTFLCAHYVARSSHKTLIYENTDTLVKTNAPGGITDHVRSHYTIKFNTLPGT
jgi:hypothetical protein